jgi:hypothetical protein
VYVSERLGNISGVTNLAFVNIELFRMYSVCVSFRIYSQIIDTSIKVKLSLALEVSECIYKIYHQYEAHNVYSRTNWNRFSKYQCQPHKRQIERTSLHNLKFCQMLHMIPITEKCPRKKNSRRLKSLETKRGRIAVPIHF